MSSTPTAPLADSSRLPFIDFLRAVASQLIVWHHLAFYGPLSDYAYPIAPWAIDWLYVYARMAVQVFFVVGGFFTARSLAKQKTDVRSVGRAVWGRYKRIGVPYLATLLIAIGANELARQFMEHPSISGRPELPQLLAHAAFLHDILGFEPLTTGIWYLAIDFQLGLLTLFIVALCTWVAGALKSRLTPLALAQAVFGLLAIAALFVFNRDDSLDHYAIYFFGSYFLGMALHWTLSKQWPAWIFGLYVAAMAAANYVEWRPRLVVAAGTGVAIWLANRLGILQRWPDNRAIAYLGKTSYSLFLVHFPMCLVTNAIFADRLKDSPLASWGAMALAVAVSMGAAALFYRFIEVPSMAAAKGKPMQQPQPAQPTVAG